MADNAPSQSPDSGTSQPPADDGLAAVNKHRNSQIDEARRTLEALGLTREELLQRTQRIGDGGHVNPNYDSQLASMAQLAAQRMSGDDPDRGAFYWRYLGTSAG